MEPSFPFLGFYSSDESVRHVFQSTVLLLWNSYKEDLNQRVVCEVWVIRYFRENLWTAIRGVDAKGRVPWSKLPAPELSLEEMGGPPLFPSSLSFVFTI